MKHMSEIHVISKKKREQNLTGQDNETNNIYL